MEVEKVESNGDGDSALKEEQQNTEVAEAVEIEQLNTVVADAGELSTEAVEAPIAEQLMNTKKWFNAEYILHIVGLPSKKAGLLLSFYIANYQTKALISVLTDEWGMSLFSAVIITDVHEGAKDVLAVFTAWLADAFVGHSLTLVYKAMLYSGGLLLWFLMYPFYVARLFIPGLVLIIAGQSGCEEYYKNFENEDEGNNNNNNNNHREQERGVEQHQQQGNETEQSNTRSFAKEWKQFRVLIKTYWIRAVGLIIVLFLIPYEHYKNFLIPALMLFASSALLFTGMLFGYLPFTRAMGSPFTVILRVLLAAFKKRHNDDVLRTFKYFGEDQHIQSSEPPTEIINQIPDHENQLDFTDQLRSLNRAALYDSEREDPKRELEKRRLCTVQQVEDTKQFTRNILLSLVFVMYGIMSAIGDTFFIEQASNMYDAYIGSFRVPVEIYALGPEAIRKLVNYLCDWICRQQVESSRSRFNGAYRIGLGMLLSIPCFGIAYRVEAQRLKAINDGDNISTSKLFPQLILIGIMDGLAIDGIACFFTQEMPDNIANSYATVLAEGIVGIGKLLSVVWFSLWYYGTMTIGGKSWFGKTINESHVDYYYVAMAIFGFVSFIIYVLVAFKYSHR